MSFPTRCPPAALAATLLAIAALAPQSALGQAVLTPGTITGTVYFDADFTPASVEVDAANLTSAPERFTATTVATHVTTVGTVSQWSYTLTVEAAGGQSYHVRPVAFPGPSAGLVSQVAFPPSAAEPVGPSATSPPTIVDVTYAPVRIGGTIELRDGVGGSLLPLDGFILAANDQAPWGDGDLVVPDDRARLSPNLARAASKAVLEFGPGTTSATYSLYLSPGTDYVLGQQEIGSEGVLLRAGFLEPFTAPGADATRNYRLAQGAFLTGQLTLSGVAGFEAGVTVSGPAADGRFFQVLGVNSSAPPGEYIVRFFEPDPTFADNAAWLVLPATARVRARFDLPGAFDPAPYLRTATKPDIPVASGADIDCVADPIDCNFAVTPDFLEGRVIFAPPRQLRARDIDLEGPGGAGIRAELAPDGSFLSPIADPLDEYRMRLNFDMGSSQFVSLYQGNIRPMDPIVPSASGGTTVRREFPEGTADVKVFMSVADGRPLSAPRLDAVTGVPVRESAQGLTGGQVGVTVGEARLVLLTGRPDPFRVRASAEVDGSRADFGTFELDPLPGEVIVIGTEAGLTLTIREPSAGDVFRPAADIRVLGEASDETQVVSVTVNGDPLVLSPPAGAAVAFDASIGAPFEPGEFDLVFVATDSDGNTVSDIVTVNVVSNVAVVSAAVECLWPPNHALVEVPIEVIPPAGDASDYCAIIDVASNEPPNDLGDGNTEADWAFSGAPNDLKVELRAERSGLGNGRVYTVTAGCFDAVGVTSQGKTEICVPHDQRGKGKKK